MASVDADSRAGVTSALTPLRRIGLVATLVVALDQLTKWWAIEALTDPSRTIDLFWTLRFNLLYNRGTAFSLTDDSGPIVSVIAVLVIALLLRSGRHQQSAWVGISYGLVIGGTLGNLLDRVFREGEGLLRGGVVDFIDFQWFPVFNIADAALVIGIGVLLLVGFLTDAFEDGSPSEPADADE